MNTIRVAYVAAAIAAASLSQDPSTQGRIERVTLYRGQALVTRSLVVDGAAGAREIVVPGLPEQVVASSLFAESGDGVDVRAVRYRSRATGDEPREAVRKLDDEIALVSERALANGKAQETVQRRLATLDKLENFVAPTASVEMSKGVLDPAALEKLVLFNFEQRKKATDEILALMKEAKDLEAQAALLAQRRAELTQGATKAVREGVLFLEKRRDGPATVRLSYIVTGCGWSPSYNFRGGGVLASVDVECNALIQQMSGEDWSDVALTLSTASPGLNATPPAVAPFLVEIRPGPTGRATPEAKIDVALVLENAKSIQQRREVASNANRLAYNSVDNVATTWAMNEAAMACQTLELVEGRELLASLAGHVAAEGPSLTYPLDAKVSLASRPDQQLVRIAAVTLKSTGYHVANPVLTAFVYREAELHNESPFDFLDGPMNVYHDGAFVGRGELSAVTRGQSFVVGFGVDPQLRARREQTDKAERIQGGNKLVTLGYRLVVDNFKGTPAAVRIMDRLPHADRQDALSVTVSEQSQKFSDDPAYKRLERPLGILRWDAHAPAGANGEKAFVITYAYTLEHDKNFDLASPGAEATQKAQQEFERRLRQRQGR